MKLNILVFDGFDELDALAPYEVFQTAKTMGAELDTQLVTIDGNSSITAAHGAKILPHSQLNLEGNLDILLIPGGGWGNRAENGAWAESNRGEIPMAIARLHQQGTTIASVCTGAMLVATAGVLKGRPATTHHVAISDLTQAGAQIVDARVVDDGEIITAGGVTSGLDLSLWLIEKHFGQQLCKQVERELEYKRRDGVWQRLQG